MPKSKQWESVPVRNEIVNLLIRNRGELLTTDLLRQLSIKFTDFTYTDLMDVLFKMEVRSFIHVIPIKKDVSKVEINKYGNFSSEIKKQIKSFMH